MTVNKHPINQIVRLDAVFTVGGIVADPIQVILFIQKPDSSELQYYYTSGSITRLSTGTFYYDLLVDTPGNWYYRFEGDGVEAAAEKQFIGERSEFYGSHFAT